MFGLWKPDDNKFVTDLQILMEQVRNNIKKMETETKLNSNIMSIMDAKIDILSSILQNLQGPKTRIVSLTEYRSIRLSLNVLSHNKHSLSGTLANQLAILKAEKERIPFIEKEIEKVRFKLLEFKREK